MMLLFVLRLGKEDAVVVALTDSVLVDNVVICCKSYAADEESTQ